MGQRATFRESPFLRAWPDFRHSWTMTHEESRATMRSQIPQKAESSKMQDRRNKQSERRANPRYRLSPPPEVEILRSDNGAPIQANFGDVSRGGCYVLTDCVLPLETEVTVTLKKGGDHVKAQARVVRAVPHGGLVLEFGSMEEEAFRLLESWLSVFVATTWAAANRRRSHRVAMQIEVRVSGYNREGARFTEDTHTVEISGYGCLLILRTVVNKGQRVVLTNLQSKKSVECMVAY